MLLRLAISLAVLRTRSDAERDLESELDRLGIQCVDARPYHPQTCGKVERFHQTLKLFLAKQAPAESLAHLPLQLDAFRRIYSQQRPHRALGGHTPLQAFHARLKASPSLAQPEVGYRICATDSTPAVESACAVSAAPPLPRQL
jgi:transposase InsO family protein